MKRNFPDPEDVCMARHPSLWKDTGGGRMEFEKVCNSIAEVLNVDPAEIRPETTFQEDLGADSLDIYQIVMKIEEEFEIRINEKDVENIRTVAEAMELITGRCG